MLFKKLIFNNFKTYYGHQEINFYIPKVIREEENKNIILIGGLNGTGKTTILKAILYVLFGKRGISEDEYKKLFSNVINHTFFDEGGRTCSVTLILETDRGEEWELKTKWNFDHNKRPVNEVREVVVRKPGVRVGQYAHVANIEAYNKYIDRMIPYHAAPFFIFDGEEIKEIILRQNSAEMTKAIHKIIGIEAYKLLLGDLQALKRDLERKLANKAETRAAEQFETQLSDIEQEIKELSDRRKALLDDKHKLETQIFNTKKLREEKLVQNSKSREHVLKKQSAYHTQLKMAQSEFNEYYRSNVVWAILKHKIQRLKQRIKLEKECVQKKQAYESALIPYRKFFNQLQHEEISPPLTSEQLEQLKVIGEEIWVRENHINFKPNDEVTIIHDLNNADYSFLINLPIVDQTKLGDMINNIELLRNKIEELEIELRDAPESVDLNIENTKIDMYTKDLGRVELRLKSVNKKLSKLKENQRRLLNNLTRVKHDMEDFAGLQYQYDYTKKVIEAMKEYISEVTMLKAQFIHEQFATMLMKLFRKQDEFGKIEFDINTYTVRLFNDHGQEISIHDRSAGEMQMIASAFIWALTKASELSLPMVIDTPLGRLDSFHRNHLINHYYKALSKQVIILSTDTEITKEYVELMKMHSYKQYMLDYDQAKKYTTIREGYFEFMEV